MPDTFSPLVRPKSTPARPKGTPARPDTAPTRQPRRPTPPSPGPTRLRRTRREADRLIRRLAVGQHGVVTRRQLLALGVTSAVIDQRLRAGWLDSIYRGVYRVGPVEAPRGRLMAAVLACGPSARLSHFSAAAVWHVDTGPRPSRGTHVSITEGNRRHSGIRVHRVSTLEADETTVFDGLPITTPPRTLLDLAPFVPTRRLERAVRGAIALGLTTPEELEARVARHSGRRGTRALAAVLGSGHLDPARSRLEERFLESVRSSGLPRPRLNREVCGYVVDFLWPAERLVVETDGFDAHRSRQAFEGDRRRDAALAAAGYRVQRVTWRQLDDEPLAVLVRVAQALVR